MSLAVELHDLEPLDQTWMNGFAVGSPQSFSLVFCQ